MKTRFFKLATLVLCIALVGCGAKSDSDIEPKQTEPNKMSENLNKSSTKKTCAVPNCPEPELDIGLCMYHYSPYDPERPCAVEGCMYHQYDGKYCIVHYTENKIKEANLPSDSSSTVVVSPTPDKFEEALEKAKRKILYDPYSYDGLYRNLLPSYNAVGDLMQEGYTEEEAKYAVDNCGADWCKMAAWKAAEWSEEVALSRESLYQYLTNVVSFTEEEATYGVENANIDWNKEAVSWIRLHYMEEMRDYKTNPDEKLVEILEEDGFTHEEAAYGVEHGRVNLYEYGE